MWFKNLTLYRVVGIELDVQALQQAMMERIAKPLGDFESRRYAWQPPAGKFSEQIMLESNGHLLMTMMKQERMLPGSVVNDAASDKVAALEKEEGCKVTRKERQAIKEQVIETLLPKAFVKRTRVDAWWDTVTGIIGINASSRARAEEVLNFLRETMGSLKVVPLSTQQLPVRKMTQWLTDPPSRPADLVLGDSVTLRAKGDDGAWQGKSIDVDSDETHQLLETGRQATKLALSLEGHLSMVLHDDLVMARLSFADAVIEEADHADDGDDPVARIHADFAIMAGCLRTSIARIVEWMGGETERQSVEQ